MKDLRTEKELDDLKAMREASKYCRPSVLTLEEIKRLRRIKGEGNGIREEVRSNEMS